MALTYLPNEIWFKICQDLTPIDISKFILNFSDKDNRDTLIGISFQIIKKYYSEKHCIIERLFILGININKIDSKEKWINEFIILSNLKIQKDYDIKTYMFYRNKFLKNIKNKKNKKKFKNITKEKHIFI